MIVHIRMLPWQQDYYHADRPWTLCSSRDKVHSLAGQTSVVSSCDAHDPTWRQATWW